MSNSNRNNNSFHLATALRCGGLAFDSYVEPAPNSSRWERGSSGLNVAFVSAAYTRQLYQGLVEITVQKCTGLPADSQDSVAERLLSGSGVDACLLTAVLEGQWKEDVAILEQEQYHTGVLDLTGAAHVSRSTTCWASVNQERAVASERKNGRSLPYYVPATWGKGAEAIWPETEPPVVLYVQDPSTARLVFTVLDDDKLGDGTAVGSTYQKLADLIPQAALQQTELIDQLKQKVLDEIRRTGSLDALDDVTKFQLGASAWQGVLPLTSKPRKKDKNGQILAGAVAGAALGGPLFAAAGAVLGGLYEGSVEGSIHLRIRYLPLPTALAVPRQTHTVQGGMPGIDWGTLYDMYQSKLRVVLPSQKTVSLEEEEAEQQQHLLSNVQDQEEGNSEDTSSAQTLQPICVSDDNNVDDDHAPPQSVGERNDLEHCFFVTHSKTGATAAVYRSLEQKLIVVSFRGTCALVDLITDASLIQETWIEGEDVDNQSIPKVHVGFRTSLNSVARRLKELILAVPAPGDDISNYNMLVTGHSLGGALATLFTADVGQYGLDAGRGLPQLQPSEPWWKAVTNVLFSQDDDSVGTTMQKEPPRPKTLRLYNFGSPRVGNVPFAELFDALRVEGMIDQAYRIVNGEDVVARLPRTVNALVFGNINYEHVGTTVLLSLSPSQPSNSNNNNITASLSSAASTPVLWIEGESDDSKCPVRDGVPISSPLAEGTLLGDLVTAARESFLLANDDDDGDCSNTAMGSSSWTDKLTLAASKVTERMKQVKASDIASMVGIDQSFTDRELRMISSIVQGKALAHHLEDEYYAGMGRASGFLARVGEELVDEEATISAV